MQAIDEYAVPRVTGIPDTSARDLQQLAGFQYIQSHTDGKGNHLVSGRVGLVAVENLVGIVLVHIAALDDIAFAQSFFDKQQFQVFS